jgi:hypothetical protein
MNSGKKAGNTTMTRREGTLEIRVKNAHVKVNISNSDKRLTCQYEHVPNRMIEVGVPDEERTARGTDEKNNGVRGKKKS